VRKRLLLLTLWFPYGGGESFLETELPYLVEQFDVEIIPCLPRVTHLTRRRIPSGAVVHEKLARELSTDLTGKVAWLVSHPHVLPGIGKMVHIEQREIGWRWSRLRRFLGYAAHSVMINTFLRPLCAAGEIAGVYGYWLTVPMAWYEWKKAFPHIPLVARAHGMDLYEERSPQRYLCGQRQMMECADRVFCVSEDGAAWLKGKYPEFHQKVEVSRLGVPEAPLRNRGNTRGEFHIVTCSYLVPWKRVSLLIEALSRCPFPLVWTHLGGGELEGELRERAEKTLPARIRWRITGELSREEVLRFYQEIPVDLFVNVSETEGLPVSIMEAMSYGIPVAATDVGGTREIVIHGENGHLWSVNVSPEEIAGTLQWFFRLPGEKRQRMQEAAWRIWYERVNAESQYPGFVEKLKEIFS